ncbi:hypothetical protein GDO86_006624 [Hymenochirus boettgeri]|uniref:Uncharacterized protein n=1 Tax=Hymenochirus boettgeri TaxID=247094 RepID=A0A8T2JB88_9PIPI|nr:hypothetical protein GDO86_006624 [Hymenochirus boettgeri]
MGAIVFLDVLITSVYRTVFLFCTCKAAVSILCAPFYFWQFKHLHLSFKSKCKLAQGLRSILELVVFFFFFLHRKSTAPN